MKRPPKTAQEIKTLIIAQMTERGLAMRAEDLLILRNGHSWSPGMQRAGEDRDVPRLTAMGEIARELGRTFRYSASRGLSRNSAAAYV